MEKMIYIGSNISNRYDCYVAFEWFVHKKQFLADNTFIKATWLKHSLVCRKTNVVIPANMMKYSDKALKLYDLGALVEKGLVKYEEFKENSFSSKEAATR